MSTFASRNKQDWEELESLIRRARKWGKPLSSEERERLDVLYRRTTVHLARVSTRSSDKVLIDYLNQLTASAHSIIYLPPRGSIVGRIGQFVIDDFPRAIARNWRPHVLSLVLLVAGALIGYFASLADPVLCHALWPSEDPRQPGASAEQLISFLRHGREDSGGMKFLMSSFLFQHNFTVSVLAIGTGILAGVPTVFLMLFNGMLLGVFAAIHHQAGIDAEMWAWILPHSITELSAITLCGGVGLMLGQAVVSPGTLTRTQSLLKTGREAGIICMGAAGMLVAAALIESYIRQSSWSTAARFVFAGSTAFFWISYLVLGYVRNRTHQNAVGSQPGAPST